MQLSRSFRVLIVDDSADERMLVREYLMQDFLHSSSILEACDLEETAWHLEKSSPDCLILDYLMGAETGLEILEELREKLPIPPVIFMSGFADPELRVEAEKLGVEVFLNKNDITVERLQEEITKVMSTATKS